MTMAGPNFLYIGMQRSGSTWLYKQLRSADRVWMPPVKELSFFCGNSFKKGNLRRATSVSNDTKRDEETKERDNAFLRQYRNGMQGTADLDWYRSLFVPKGDKISGDISPQYSTLPDDGVRQAVSALPEAKFVLFVRHPISRLESALNKRLRRGIIDERCFCDVDRLSGILSQGVIERHSFPTEIWRKWSSSVKPDRIHFWFFEEVVADPHRVRCEVANFIGVPTAKFHIPANHNPQSKLKKYRFSVSTRQLVEAHFSDEISRCRRVFRSYALNW
jgi:hypothetical protein